MRFTKEEMSEMTRRKESSNKTVGKLVTDNLKPATPHSFRLSHRECGEDCGLQSGERYMRYRSFGRK